MKKIIKPYLYKLYIIKFNTKLQKKLKFKILLISQLLYLETYSSQYSFSKLCNKSTKGFINIFNIFLPLTITHKKLNFSNAQLKKNSININIFNLTRVDRLLTNNDEIKSNIFRGKYFSFLNKFLINFLQFLFNMRIHLSFKKLWWQGQQLENYKAHNYIISTIKRYTKKIKNYRFISNFYKMLWISMKIKDSNFFLRWFCIRIELLFYKLHRSIPYLVNITLKQFSKRLFKQTGAVGIFFSLRGKIGVTGDSKKRHSCVKYGKHSSTTKSLKISIAKLQIRTRTGVMGATYGIFF